MGAVGRRRQDHRHRPHGYTGQPNPERLAFLNSADTTAAEVISIGDYTGLDMNKVGLGTEGFYNGGWGQTANNTFYTGSWKY